MDFCFSDNSETIYVLKIYDELNNKEYNLKLPGDRNVAQVKADTFTLTDIPARHQIWCGWPENITDDSRLYELDLDQPFHCLTVQSSNIVEESPLNNSVISISSTDTPPSPVSNQFTFSFLTRCWVLHITPIKQLTMQQFFISVMTVFFFKRTNISNYFLLHIPCF